LGELLHPLLYLVPRSPRRFGLKVRWFSGGMHLPPAMAGLSEIHGIGKRVDQNVPNLRVSKCPNTDFIARKHISDKSRHVGSVTEAFTGGPWRVIAIAIDWQIDENHSAPKDKNALTLRHQ